MRCGMRICCFIDGYGMYRRLFHWYYDIPSFSENLRIYLSHPLLEDPLPESYSTHDTHSLVPQINHFFRCEGVHSWMVVPHHSVREPLYTPYY